MYSVEYLILVFLLGSTTKTGYPRWRKNSSSWPTTLVYHICRNTPHCVGSAWQSATKCWVWIYICIPTRIYVDILNVFRLVLPGNNLAEVDFLLRSARAFIEAERAECHLGFSSNDHSNVQAALQSYNQALLCLDEDSVMRAAIIREVKKIQPHSEATSGFVSPAHRIRDLELAAYESVCCGDYVAALKKRTDIFENIVERKTQSFYIDVLKS